MNKKLLNLLVALSVATGPLYAQGLFMPRGVKQAFDNNTRSLNGMPGKNYWENHAHYRIDVTATPPNRIVKGKETIAYFNNSPDTLKSLIIKLFLNIHKPGAARGYPASPDYLSDGITIDTFKVEGQVQPMPGSDYDLSYARVQLPNGLLPHDSLHLAVDWHFQMSIESGREGMIDSTTYYVAYFYPRIAVYDDYNGWDRMQFVDTHEFYSDFNDYVVTFHVPANFVVWGTGTLQHPEQLLKPEYLKRYQLAMKVDSTVHVATFKDMVAKRVTTQNPMNSWQFVTKNIPDMAFGLSDHYVWDAGSVMVSDTRRVGAQAAYSDTAKDYAYMVKFAKHALDWLSHNWPGVPYPYEKSTVFQGYAGMEYPMMVNDESYQDTVFSRFVAEHEIAHTYMPFYMGINETRYGFMDEGWATTFEYLIGTADLGKDKADQFYKRFRIARMTHDLDPSEQVPIITPGDAQTGQGFGNNEYGKASLGYLAMKDLLGDDLFKKCLQAYMDRWHGKHPLPWDFFDTFNNVSGRDLNWFWNNWYFSNSYIDFAVKDVTKAKGGYKVTIDNIGGFFAPGDLKISYSDGSTDIQHLSPETWHASPSQATVNIATKKKVSSVKLDGGIWMDADESNNSFEVK